MLSKICPLTADFLRRYYSIAPTRSLIRRLLVSPEGILMSFLVINSFKRIFFKLAEEEIQYPLWYSLIFYCKEEHWKNKRISYGKPPYTLISNGLVCEGFFS